MPIPDFDHNDVLPPHLGNPAVRSDLSPYDCSSLEIVDRFATSRERAGILTGFFAFRAELHQRGLLRGYQWLDGSFLEDIEKLESRAPKDLDVLTIFWGYDVHFLNQLAGEVPAFIDRNVSMAQFRLDHFPLFADESPEGAVENTRYWIQLFTHRRNGVWKGMLKIPLGTMSEDAQSLGLLQTKFP